jgi:acyl-CoA synthetase (AMP-forming)/AMP-acid ligase II
MTAVSTISRLIHHWASTQPDAIALLGVNRDPLTYGQLYRHLGQVAGALRGQGIAPGDPVAVVLPNGPDMAAAFGAIAAAALLCAVESRLSGTRVRVFICRIWGLKR